MADKIFMSGEGIELANKLSPIIDTNTGENYDPIDAVNGIGMVLMRRLGDLERAQEPRLRQWVQEYALFILTRFAALNETD